jgi:hypothetical protein
MYQNTTTIYTLIPPFLLPNPLPLIPTSREDLLFPPVLHFIFYGYIDSPRGFHRLDTSSLYTVCFITASHDIYSHDCFSCRQFQDLTQIELFVSLLVLHFIKFLNGKFELEKNNL